MKVKGWDCVFLRHIERNSLLLFMVPADSDDIKKEYEVLLNELKQYNSEMLLKTRILAVTKSDMLDEELTAEMKKDLPDIPSIFISSVAEKGIVELKDMIWQALQD